MPLVRDLFETPHDRRPGEIFVLTAYLDESGHESKGFIIMAGFLGDAVQWTNCELSWKAALGNRKHLHMQDLRWSKPERVKRLLDVLGPVPHSAPLQALVSTVNIADIEDLLDGTQMQKLMKGYFLTLLGTIHLIASGIPPEETFKLVLEAQNEYAYGVHQTFLGTRDMLTPSGARKLISVEFVDKDQSCLTEPSDFLAYAILQQHRDPGSEKARLCAPILKNLQPALVRHHSEQKEVLRDYVRGMIERHPNLMRSRDDGERK